MASPESTRTGGSRPSGAGVKGLLAMFEKSNPASPAPANGSTTAGTSSRDQSPAGPRPLGKVRTSFVTVTGNNNGLLGLQKVPVSPSVTSPTVTFPEGQKLSGEALEALGKEHPAIDSRDQITEALNGVRTPDELSSKRDFGIINGGRFSQPKQEPVKPTVLLPAFEKVSTKKDETPVTPIEPARESHEDGEKKEDQAKATPSKEEPKPKSGMVKGAPAPRSPTKSASNRTAKSVTANKSGKTLSLPPSKSNTTSPLPSPAFPPKSPARNAASSLSSSSRAKPTTSATNTVPASSRARTPAVASTSAVPKPRPAAAAVKAKAAVTQKPEVAKPAREPTKPPTIRSSAFAPTAASAAKLAAEQKAAATRNTRAPSSASVRNRSPPEGSVAMRRGNSGTGSSRPGRKEQRSPQRPQTSAAIRNPNRSSVGSLTSIAPAGAGGDFLSRMMRPTTASAGKVSDKKPAVGAPSKRSASVASTSRRREPSLPPSIARLVNQKTGEKKTEVTQDAVPEVKETIAEAAQESKAETPEEPLAPVESSTPEEAPVEQAPVEQAAAEETRVPVAIEVPVTKDEAEVNEEEDEGQSPTTTTSSTTLVHEGEGKDGEEPAPLVKE